MTEQLIILIEIILIDLVLAGDNAIIIGMVASKFESQNRKKIIIWGIGGAVVLRIIFTFITAYLLQITGLRLIGGILLLYICYKLYRDVIQNKIEQGNYYQKLLNEYNDILITPPKELNGSKNHYWVFGIVLKNKGIRDSVMNEMHMKGIETRPFFWPLHLQPSLPEELKRKNYALTVSEDIGENGFYIPLGNHINKKIQQKISQWYKQNAK